MALRYPQYYRTVGVRKEQDLLGFKFKPLKALTLPLQPIYHYLPANTQETGVDAHDYFVSTVKGLTYCGHVVELASTEGGPTRLPINAMNIVRELERKNRSLRRIRNFETIDRDMRSMLIYNYSVIQHLYRYRVSFMQGYQRWYNTAVTMVENINELAAVSQRQHYIRINLPEHMPRLAILRAAEGTISRLVLDEVRSPESMMILDLWLWAGKEHYRSVLSKLKPEVLDRVNLLFVDNDKGAVVNLSYLDAWRRRYIKSDDQESEEISGSPEAFQRKTLFFAVRLAKLRTENALTEIAEAVGSDTVAADEPEIVGDLDSDEESQNDIQERLPERLKNQPAVELPDAVKSDVSEAELANYQKELETLAEGGVDLWDDSIFELHIPGKQPADINEGKKTVDLTAAPELGVVHKADKLLEHSLISTAEFRRFERLANSYKEIENPYGNGTLEDLVKVSLGDVQIDSKASTLADIESVTDKTMLSSTLLDFDKKYINEVLYRDVARMVLSLQHSGISVTGYDVERVKDAMNKFDVITIKLVPVAGQQTTVRMELPVIEEDGSWTADGVKYRLRKQRGDAPIHKVAPDKVALTSYYGKLFVKRSEKAVHNYGRWLQNKVIAASMGDNPTIFELGYKSQKRKLGSKLPRLYVVLSARFTKFETAEWQISFDYDNRAVTFGAEAMALETNGLVVIGRSKEGGKLLFVDERDTIYQAVNGQLTPVGDIGDIIGVDTNSSPIEQIEMKIAGKDVPIGFIFGYYFGLEETCKRFGVTPRKVPRGTRLNLENGDYTLRFQDEAWVFSRHDRKAAMVLSGFNRFHRQLAHYSVREFERSDVYFNLLDGLGMTARQLRELDVLKLHFIDPITKSLLEWYKEPQTFDGLLERSVELLQTDEVPFVADRFKGYERIAGAVYRELMMSVKSYHTRPLTSKAGLDLKPNAVWTAIQSDPSIMLAQDINPIHNLKEQEAVTFGGTGGRSSRTMVRSTRAYDPTDFGVVSEATVDSSEVAVNTYLTSNPNFVNLYGVTREFDTSKDGLTSVLSTASNVSIAATHDDVKRALFTGIQHSSGISAEGYTYMPCATGYDQVIPKRVSDLFAYAAKQDGLVKELSGTHLTVEYADGSIVAIELGRRFGRAEGSCYPHKVVTDMDIGQKFLAGHVLCWNDGWFCRDYLNRSEVLWKSAALFNVALIDDNDTFEDSSGVTARAAKLLKTKITKPKVVILKFDQEVRGLVKEGEPVEPDSILCTIEDQLTANSGLFDDTSLDTLRMLSSHNPKAKVEGVVEKIEVYYRGDVEDMSQSLQELVRTYDRKRTAQVKKLRRDEATTGEVIDRVRIEGQPLEQDTVAIRMFITYDEEYGGGDKLVFGNQLKSVTGHIYEGVMETESGIQVDAKFGHMSVFNRIVGSPYRIGIVNRIVLEGSKRGAALFFGE